MFYVYVLKSLTDRKRYVGMTGNLKKRIAEHEKGFTFSTKHRRPFELIYYEAHLSRESALEREKFLKTGWGRNYLNKMDKSKIEAKKLGGYET